MRERDRGEREGRERYLGGEEAEVGEAVGQRRGGEVADGRGLRALLQAGLGQAVAVGLIRVPSKTAVEWRGRRGQEGKKRAGRYETGDSSTGCMQNDVRT